MATLQMLTVAKNCALKSHIIKRMSSNLLYFQPCHDFQCFISALTHINATLQPSHPPPINISIYCLSLVSEQLGTLLVKIHSFKAQYPFSFYPLNFIHSLLTLKAKEHERSSVLSAFRMKVMSWYISGTQHYHT